MDDLGDDRAPAGDGGLLDFDCPRCGAPATGRWYGPCDGCRAALRAEVAGDARVADVGDYVPKVNVTPNAVALKDD
ncbi:MAG TPA: hypothetical protein VFI47_28150 [Acidimicrobiales bacterium]|nr:hypothetical protein [Acidimicrobiales bacterium]